MLCDIKSLLRAGHSKRELKLALPTEESPVYTTAHSDMSANLDRHPSPRKPLSAISHDLGNFSLANFPTGIFSGETERDLQMAAWKSAIRAVPDDPELTFPPATAIDPTSSCDGDSGLAREDSDMATIFGSVLTTSTTRMIQTTDLLSWEEIHCPKFGLILPPLIVRHNDMVGDRRLEPMRDSYMFCDISSDLYFILCNRGVNYVPELPSLDFHREHAVRVFLEAPSVPGIKNGPFYKYIGDCYIVKTELYLPRADWAIAPDHLKDLFVNRFIKANRNVDNYRTRNDFALEDVYKLFARGYIFPLVRLRQVHRDHYESESALGFEVASAKSSKDSATLRSAKNSASSSDSASIYSQESGSFSGDCEQASECVFETYSSAARLHIPSSPVLTLRVRRGAVVKNMADTSALTIRPFASSEDMFALGQEAERSVFEDDFEDEDVNLSGDGFQAGQGYIEAHEELAADSDALDDGHSATQEDDNGLDSKSGPSLENPGANALQHTADFVLRVMHASYDEIQAFCAYLRETSDPATEHGRTRLRILGTLEEYSLTTPWDDDGFRSDSFGHHLGHDDADLDDHDDSLDAYPGRPPMLPWFEGFEPLPAVIAEDRL